MGASGTVTKGASAPQHQRHGATTGFPSSEANQRRDSAAISSLTDLGWSVVVVWECETDDLSSLKDKLVSFLD